MPDSLILQQYDVGIDFKATITSDGRTPVNLSQASGIKFYFSPPNQSTYNVDASFISDGVDGRIHYVSQSTDLTVKGRWKIQASYQLNGYTRHTSYDSFIVISNI